MESRVLEGTWDELAAHADELRTFGKLKLVIAEPELGKQAQMQPNEQMLEVMREIAVRHRTRRKTSSANTDRLVREARAGAMYGYEPSE